MLASTARRAAPRLALALSRAGRAVAAGEASAAALLPHHRFGGGAGHAVARFTTGPVVASRDYGFQRAGPPSAFEPAGAMSKVNYGFR
jgi:hypothetical protein